MPVSGRLSRARLLADLSSSGEKLVRHLLRLALTAVSLIVSATPALASGEMPPLVRDIGLAVLFSGMLGVLLSRIKVPTIAGFLLAGVAVGPLGFGLITDTGSISTIAQLGFILLLFVIGLEVDIKRLLVGESHLFVSGTLQFPLTVIFGYIVISFLDLSSGGDFFGGNLGALYIGAVIAGSSTLLALKLYQEALELDTVPGRIAIGLLVFQDLWAIVVLLLQPSLHAPKFGEIVGAIAGIVLLAIIAALLARTLVQIAFRWIAKMPEVILIGSVSWCFAVVLLGANLEVIARQLFGISFHIDVNPGIAALIAGTTIANLPYATEIKTKVSVVKDFFVTLFFVGLGMSIPQPTGWYVFLLAGIIAAVAILARLAVYFPLFYWTGVDQRNAMVASLRLAQISEFGLVITYIGLELGHLSSEVAGAIIFAFVFTALTTTPLFHTAYRIHGALLPFLAAGGFREPSQEADSNDKKDFRLVLLGFHRVASSLLHDIARDDPALAADTLVIDFNAAIHPRIRATGAQVEYGDLSNPESLLHAGIDRARIVVSTVSDDLLRGIDNRLLVRCVRSLNPSSIIIANAVSLHDCAAIYAAGADYVFLQRLETARALNEAIKHALHGTLPELRARAEFERQPEDRDEVFP
jgi:Kef-type K+ transport system membrane component KefB